jgi:hypothetical protein
LIPSAREENVSSAALPGGDLVSAVLDRRIMGLADRGGASGMVGSRWADICADHADLLTGMVVGIPGRKEFHRIERVYRLDDDPAVAGAASRLGIQNPDLLFIGQTSDEAPVVQAGDAKFSVETARSKQVSPPVLEELLKLEALQRHLADAGIVDATAVPGVFLCPNSLLTKLMLNGRQGIRRTTISKSEVMLVDFSTEEFLAGLEGAALVPKLEKIDALSISSSESLLAALYYFRIVRACVGCWTEGHRPLLAMNDVVEVDFDRIEQEIQRRRKDASSAFALVLDWDEDLETVRKQRSAVDHVAGLPIANRDLRALVEEEAQRHDLEPPSVNRVRRKLGAWYRGQIRAEVGELRPPIHDFSDQLLRIAAVGRRVAPGIEAQAREIVREVAVPVDPHETPDVSRT